MRPQLSTWHWASCLTQVLTIASLATAATVQNETTAVCLQLSQAFGNITFLPSQNGYLSLSEENWSATSWAEPTCIVQALDTQQLQAVVQILISQDAPFAIRSGGHMPSPLAANINNGVLLDISMFNQASYDSSSNSVTIGPGLRWGDVYTYLDQYNVTVVGGRVLDVGVGGLILGSGLSYLSDLYGLACDNVLNFEVILADGSVINANATANQDLFWALKGGSNNFGIVTAFKISTYPIHEVWGGFKEYSLDQLPALFTALSEYQSVPDKDPYANLMLQAAVTNASIGVLLNMVYLKPEESPSAYDPFYPIPTIADTTKIQTLTEMLSGQVQPAIPRWDFRATSFTPNSTLYQQIQTIITTAPELASIESLNSGTLVLGLQPISSSVIREGDARGGNALGLESVNQTWAVLDAGWEFSDDDSTEHNATRAILDRIENASVESGDYVPYIFMNDASWDQDVIGHYGSENVQRLKTVQRKYDPDFVFQRLVSGGFKIPQT